MLLVEQPLWFVFFTAMGRLVVGQLLLAVLTHFSSPFWPPHTAAAGSSCKGFLDSDDNSVAAGGGHYRHGPTTSSHPNCTAILKKCHGELAQLPLVCLHMPFFKPSREILGKGKLFSPLDLYEMLFTELWMLEFFFSCWSKEHLEVFEVILLRIIYKWLFR